MSVETQVIRLLHEAAPEKLRAAEVYRRGGFAHPGGVAAALSKLSLHGSKPVLRESSGGASVYSLRPGIDVEAICARQRRTGPAYKPTPSSAEKTKPAIVQVFKALGERSFFGDIAGITGLPEHQIRRSLDVLMSVRRVVELPGDRFGRVDGDSPLPDGLVSRKRDDDIDVGVTLAQLRARRAALDRAIAALEALREEPA